MNPSEQGESQRNKLRHAIAEISVQVSRLSTAVEGQSDAQRFDTLASSWGRLVPLIQPDAEPERRECPHCHGRIMLQATRCVYCLEKSAQPERG